MSAERDTNHEQLPGEFEFSLVFGALKAKLMKAKDEQKQMVGYRLFTTDRVDAAKDALVRFRLVDSRFTDDLQAAAQNPDAVVDVGLPVAIPSSTDPILISDTVLGQEELDYFVLYKQAGPIVVDAAHMQHDVLNDDPDFTMKALNAEVVPMSKPSENER